jgi:hypothetical protein
VFGFRLGTTEPRDPAQAPARQLTAAANEYCKFIRVAPSDAPVWWRFGCIEELCGELRVNCARRKTRADSGVEFGGTRWLAKTTFRPGHYHRETYRDEREYYGDTFKVRALARHREVGPCAGSVVGGLIGQERPMQLPRS